MKNSKKIKILFYSIILSLFSISKSISQSYIVADPYYLLLNEKAQFSGILPIQSNIFRPQFINKDSTKFSFTFKGERYINNNAPNQENMDVRYFSKGISNFTSLLFTFNSPYIIFMGEPYIIQTESSLPVSAVDRYGVFSVLNDRPIHDSHNIPMQGFRNLLAFVHYKGMGIGWHKGNRWWGPGIHTNLQMTTNTFPLPAQIIGTIRELRIGSFGFYGLYTFARLNKEKGVLAKYFTSINGELTWYGPIILSAGFSRNYLTGGEISAGYEWTENDARKIIFEGIFTKDLIGLEYTVGGHDVWDQKLSGYFSIILPNRDLKVYVEVGMNDNRMYFADFLSQPDHSMATVFGIRDYGVGENKNWLYGFEWANLMITYTSRHRGYSGAGPWYEEPLYDYSSYNGRRWGAHSGGDSDDWYIYAGYLSDKLMIVPAFNYERHGIVSHRPAEVKMEFRLDTRYNYKGIWLGIFFEKQLEAFLGFPDYFYVDKLGNSIDASEGDLANTRNTNTLIISLSKNINF